MSTPHALDDQASDLYHLYLWNDKFVLEFLSSSQISYSRTIDCIIKDVIQQKKANWGIFVVPNIGNIVLSDTPLTSKTTSIYKSGVVIALNWISDDLSFLTQDITEIQFKSKKLSNIGPIDVWPHKIKSFFGRQSLNWSNYIHLSIILIDS